MSKTKLANRKLKCSIKACNAIKKKRKKKEKRHGFEGGRLTALPESQKHGRFDLGREFLGLTPRPSDRPRIRAASARRARTDVVALLKGNLHRY
ncbi:hypothetical protein EVAR_35439_1 [Eumeta japonica]|uniref:Uncharacterized protein n=1 Tax=Eumeta variegata TaxID=151549 RepID=A0A4C1X8X1_EUMVA|nr:hypothetical protein EVAR_35439_1 [Eumeta japonica]